MQLKNYNVYFFFAVLIGVTVLAYFIVKPFLVPFLIAAILAHLFSPVYRFFLKLFRSTGLSAAVSCFLILLIIILPILGIISLVVSEIQGIVDNFSQNPEAVKKIVDNIAGNLSALPFFNFIEPDKITSQETIVSAVKGFSQNAVFILQGTYKGVVHFIFVAFIMFFSLFYLFIDGGKFVKKIMQLSPLQDKYESILIDKFNSITRATIKGTTLIAIVQGFLGAILFMATGVASPVLFGILMTISSVIPSVGSGLVWLPVGVAMILLGHIAEGLIILIVGALFISTIDNLMRPKLVGKDTQMHPLTILFSTLGGIALFGISGFIVGPIIMSLFVALWDIYALEFKSQLDRYNE
ncbi:MAG: AI-2E family transporter [Parcubacteria group bacterium]|jgi:predicted PurR-regulated permease PerM